jgi:Na+-driven multidrug efflux pump
MSGHGFAIAAIAAVGQSVGAAEHARARMENWEANKAAVGIMSAMGLLFFFFPYLLVRAFTPDPAVISLGTLFLKVVAAIQIPLAITMVLSGSLKGAGDTRYLLGVTFVGAWLVRIPAGFYVVSVRKWGIIFLWGVMILDWTVRMFMVLLRYRSGRWKSIRVVQEGRI